MSALAQALAKAGLADKEKAENIDKERDFFQEKYISISNSIREGIAHKRRLLKLREDIKDAKDVVEPDAYVFDCIRELFGMPPMNVAAPSNKTMILNRIQKAIDDIEKVIVPMIKASRKLEKEWGFKRDVPVRSRDKKPVVWKG
jgi:hypothetical protein